MKKYRIILKNTVADYMDESQAKEMLQMFIDIEPNKNYDIEPYDFTTSESKRYGRNPDLH
tara:strand:- start:412 stop:591 length:180 start_codon:yes stop_codon:yes gene_type:complete